MTSLLEEFAGWLGEALTDSQAAAHTLGLIEVARKAGVTFPGAETVDLRSVTLETMRRVGEQLKDRTLFVGSGYLETAAAIEQGKFALTADITAEMLGGVRDALENHLSDPDGFADEVVRFLGEGPISEGRLLQIHRDLSNTALSTAKAAAVKEFAPALDAFPFRVYYATTDQRARKEHQAMERNGIAGTNIYWAADPVWQKYQPPWNYGCRCSWSPLTVRQAAELGLRVAQQWLARAQALADENGGTAEDWFVTTAPVPDFVRDPGYETWSISL